MNYNKKVTIIIRGEKIKAPIHLLNTIAIWAMEASNHYNNIGADALADFAAKNSKEIHMQLEKMGYYKD